MRITQTVCTSKSCRAIHHISESEHETCAYCEAAPTERITHHSNDWSGHERGVAGDPSANLRPRTMYVEKSSYR